MSGGILLVEDEPSIGESLARYLRDEGYPTTWVKTLGEARRCAAGAKLLIVDWMLPDGQGVELVRELRAAGSRVPIVVLTARSELVDKVLGLELGADDYVTKPFDARELLARVRARLRATAPVESARVLRCGGIELDDDARAVTWQGREVELTRMEFGLLRLLLEGQGKVFSRDEILNKVWGFDAFPTTRTVDTHVLQLRQKFAAELFETVRGVGYRLRDPKMRKEGE